MSRQDEIDELILYVTDMRRSFTRKFDDQLFIIQQQNERLQRQSRTIDEQKDVVDELAWQIRDLRDSVRRVKEAATTGCVNCSCGKRSVDQPKPAPRRRANSVENLLEHDEKGAQSRDTFVVPMPRYARIPFERNNAFDHTPVTPDNIYECIEPPAPDTVQPMSLPNAPRSSHAAVPPTISLNQVPGERLLDRRTRYALFKNMTYRHSDVSLPDAENVQAIEGAIGKLKLELAQERESFDGTGEEEAVMLRMNALRRFPRNSQLRGSSKAVSSMISDIEEEYLPAEDHLQPDDKTTTPTFQRDVVSEANIYINDPKFPYGKGGSFRV